MRQLTPSQQVSSEAFASQRADPEPDAPKFTKDHVRQVLRWVAGFGIPAQDRPDAVQDVFRIAIETKDRLPANQLFGWLHGICRNVARNANRKRQNQGTRERPAGDLVELERTAVDLQGSGSDAVVWSRLERFLETLELRDRRIFVLRELRGMEIDEVCSAVSLSRAQVYRRLKEMQEALRALFDDPKEVGP